MTTTFRKRIQQSINDQNLQIALDNNAQRRKAGRLTAFASVPDYQERRARAHAVKADVIANLDEYLDKFIANVTENGITVHRAADSAEAVKIVLGIVENPTQRTQSNTKDSFVSLRGEKLIAKSKSMVSEEINLNHALAEHGIRVVETDLGEYIVQLRGERPSHIITPAVHLRRGDVGQLFHEKLGVPYTEDIPTLTATARKVLREVFLTADVGLSGVNFGVAESGTLCIVTNEGNGRMCTTIPPVHIALMGMERLVPTLDDLALMLSLLPRSATGQKLSVYTSLIHSPKRPNDPDGPFERHLILLDNGRSAIRHSPLAESLYCIRCGACLNACPVFREIGGHAYVGADRSIAPYPGPIGSVVSAGLFGCGNYGHLAQASSLCGACKEACPVDIDLPGLLLRIRAGEGVKRKEVKCNHSGIGLPATLKLGLRVFRYVAATPRLFAVLQTLGGILSRVYSPRQAYMRMPAWTGWGYSKDLPRLAVRPFRARWKHAKLVHPGSGIGTSLYRESVLQSASSTPVSQSTNSLIYQFTNELETLGGRVYPISEKELSAKLVEFLKSKGIDRVYVDAVGATFMVAQGQGHTLSGHLALPLQIVREPDPTARVGITGALAGIAETGSLVITSGEGRPLTASLLPEIHIAVLRAKDLYASLPQVINLREVREASAAVLITGPSRTADIEMTLTIGVHGPKELHVFVVD
ncbi:MAG: LUD domain-containing protein [Anaerolineales bacterium]|nr:LUD domain-containing protein [Anaerolineales bacterium]